MSGKKGAGKDTLAPLVTDRLNANDPVHMSCADPLKDTVDDFIGAVRSSQSHDEARQALLRVDPEMPSQVVDCLVETLYEAVHDDPNEHARSHSVPAVRALQYYGTDFRRKQDPDYWVKIAVQRASDEIAAGRFPYFTDARFPNEVDGLSAIGGLSVRLDVEPQEQLRRLQERDGRAPNPAELTHLSETALDDYANFDVRVQSDGVDSTLDKILGLIQS